MKFFASFLFALFLFALTAAAVFTPGGPAGARDFLGKDPVDKPGMQQAIITMSSAASPGNIRAIRFPAVPDLQSCFTLAYSAVNKTKGQSSATCINENGVVAATYFCAWNTTTPKCRSVRPQ